MCGRSDTKTASRGRRRAAGRRTARIDSSVVRLLSSTRMAAGHAVGDGVRPGGGGLGRPVAFRLAAGDDQARCDPGVVELDGVVEPGGEDRRRTAVVLGGAHDHDRRRGALLVALALRPDPVRRVAGHGEDDRCRPARGPRPRREPSFGVSTWRGVGGAARAGAAAGPATGGPAPSQRPWHFLYLAPEPHQHGSLRPIRAPLGVNPGFGPSAERAAAARYRLVAERFAHRSRGRRRGRTTAQDRRTPDGGRRRDRSRPGPPAAPAPEAPFEPFPPASAAAPRASEAPHGRRRARAGPGG